MRKLTPFDRIEKVDHYTGAVEHVTLQRAVQELVRRGWSKYAAWDSLTDGVACDTAGCTYRLVERD